MSSMVKNDNVLEKYNKIWDKIKEKLNIKFRSMPVYDEKYIKAKVREFDSVIKTNFLGDKIPKENKYYTCIACITTDSFMRTKKNNYPEVYLEECKYKMKKTKISKFIEAELELDSESVSKSDTKLEAKLESDSEYAILLSIIFSMFSQYIDGCFLNDCLLKNLVILLTLSKSRIYLHVLFMIICKAFHIIVYQNVFLPVSCAFYLLKFILICTYLNEC